MARTVFVDTSAWIGFFVRNDQHHLEAVKMMNLLKEDRRELLTSDYVIAEVVTRIRSLSGLEDALKVWEELESDETANLEEVDREVRIEARRFFRKYRQLQLSLVDCTSFSIMQRFGIQEVFTFDDDFKKAGFIVLPA